LPGERAEHRRGAGKTDSTAVGIAQSEERLAAGQRNGPVDHFERRTLWPVFVLAALGSLADRWSAHAQNRLSPILSNSEERLAAGQRNGPVNHFER